jgi:hypothetical protein
MPTQIACPSCEESYRIEPARLPGPRVRVACLACGEPVYLRRAGARVRSAAAPAGVLPGPARPGEDEVPMWRESRHEDVSTAVAATRQPASRFTPPPPPAPPRETIPRAEPAPEVKPFTPHLEPPALRPAASAAAPTLEPPAAPARPAPPAFEPPQAPAAEPIRREHPAAAPVATAPAAPAETAPAAATPQPGFEPSGGTAAARPGSFSFAQVGDSAARAQRLARALVSDILVYQPKKVEAGIRDGNLKDILREEVEKSWDEYCERLGPEIARANRPQFVAALNEILARGNPVF